MWQICAMDKYHGKKGKISCWPVVVSRKCGCRIGSSSGFCRYSILNRMKRTLIIYAAAVLAGGCGSIDPPQPYGPVPSPQQLEWQKMEMNMFVHFGPNTFTDVEWGSGEESADVFAPADLDCRQWVRTARDAGMKGVILTAKHHDGFCLWPNPGSRHTVAQSKWRNGKGDVLRELSDACHEYGLKLGIYISPWDRNDPSYGTDKYNGLYCEALTHALSGYGEIFEQWFDGACGEGPGGRQQVYDWDLFHDTVYSLQPDAVIFSDVGPGCRWVGNENGFAGETCWSRLDAEGFVPGKGAPPADTLNRRNVHGGIWAPAEADVSIRPGWFYRESEDDKVKTVDRLLEIYYGSVGRNALLLLNVPPDRRGQLCAIDSLRLMEFRSALDLIFGNDLAAGAEAEATAVRGGRFSRDFSAMNMLDGDYDSYWTTDDSVTSASVVFTLDGPQTFNRILLQEYIPLGQRVAGFTVEAAGKDGEWYQIAQGTTIGYKRILLTQGPVTTSAVRLNIEKSYACPVLNAFSLYLDPVASF